MKTRHRSSSETLRSCLPTSLISLLRKSFTQVLLSCFYKSLNYFKLHSVAALQLTNQEALLYEFFFCFISLINFTVHRSEMKLKTFIAFFLLLMFSGYCESKGGRGGFSSRGGGFSSRGKSSGSSGSSWFSSSKPASSPSYSRPSPSYSGSPSSYNSPSAPSYGWNVNKPSPSSGNQMINDRYTKQKLIITQARHSRTLPTQNLSAGTSATHKPPQNQLAARTLDGTSVTLGQSQQVVKILVGTLEGLGQLRNHPRLLDLHRVGSLNRIK